VAVPNDPPPNRSRRWFLGAGALVVAGAATGAATWFDVFADATAPGAPICAREVRSDRMSRRLAEAGFTDIVDMPEGMAGSGA